MPDLAQLNLVIDSSMVQGANNTLTIFVKTAGQAEQAANQFQQATERSNKSVQQHTGTLGELIKMLTALTGAYSALQTVRAAIETMAVEDRLEKGFTNILQSADQAKQVLGQLEDYSRNSQFQFTGLADAARQFMALGMSGKSAVETVTAIGNELETIGSGETTITRISTAFQRMLETGQANMYVFRSLASEGIPAVQMLAKALGTDTNTALDLLKKGAISGADAVKALTKGMEDNSRQALVTTASYTQLWQQLKNNLLLTLGDLAKELAGQAGFKGGLQALVTDIEMFAAIIADAIRNLEGLPPHFKSTSAASSELAAILRVLIGLFELLLGLSVVKWVTEFALNIPKLTMGLLSMSEGTKAAVSMLALLMAIEVGRWAETQYAPVAKLFANVQAFMKLVGMSTTWAGQSTADLIGGKGWAGIDQNSAHASNTYNQIMADYDKQINSINTRPAAPQTSFLSFISNDIGNLQKQVNAFMSGGLDIKMPNAEQFRKEIGDFQMALGGGLGDGSGSIHPQITEQLQHQLDNTITKIKDEQKTIGLITDQREKQLQILQMIQVLKDHGVDPTSAEAKNFLSQLDQEITKLQQLKEINAIGQTFGQTFSKAFGDFITGAKNASAAAKEFVNALNQMLLQKLVLDKLSNLISSGITSIGAGLIGNLAGSGDISGYVAGGSGVSVTGSAAGFQGMTTSMPFAKGGAFWNGVRMFASGGVVGSPTLFGMRGGGLGMMGESGPEAIMPLTRTSDGRLGVMAGGGGSGGNTVINNYHSWNFPNANVDSFRRSQRQVAAMVQRTLGTPRGSVQ